MDFSEEVLSELSNILCQAERFQRDEMIEKSITEYAKICQKYEELDDYPTASYFYQRCLEIAKNAKVTSSPLLPFPCLVPLCLMHG
jgi:hypothetical protein